MRKHTLALLSGSLKRAAFRIAGAMWLALLMVSPVLAQEAPRGGRTGSLLNLFLLVGIAFFLVRSFRRRGGDDNTRPGRWSRPDDDSPADNQAERPESKTIDRHDVARQTWDMLRTDTQEQTAATTPTGEPAGARVAGFDEVEFLEGAKLFFARFQQAREDGDFQPIRDFISDDIFSEAMASGVQERTEVMLLDARIMELKSDNGRTMASVFYDAQLRIGEQGERTEHVRAVWEFSRDDSRANALWVLETINRVDQ